MIVSAPASSANLGPGFDALAIAVDLPFRLAVAESAPDGFHSAEPTHPAVVAFRAAGGDPAVELRWHSPIPPGRGLGFSGAARVAGAYLAGRRAGTAHETACARATEIAIDLEGHAENAAASAHGGFVVAAAGRVVRLDLPDDVQLMVWSPAAATSTDASRRSLPTRVSLDDAAFSVGRAALWVAAVAAGDLGALREACEDRLHQDLRLQARPDSATVRRELMDRSDVLAAWLSGSGPSVAALVPRDVAPIVAAGLPGDGMVRVLDVASVGVAVSRVTNGGVADAT
ncbi:MAG: homoserine kinase [Microthrixaceae bacterium]